MSLFSSIKAGANKFGKFGARYANLTDEALMSAYQRGDADALAEFANRHPELMGGQLWSASKRMMNNPDDNAGDLWLAMDKAAKSYNGDNGASAKTWITKNANESSRHKQVKHIEDMQNNPNYDNLDLTDNKDFDSGMDALGANEDIATKEAHIAEMRDMLSKLEKELETAKLGNTGKTGKDVMNQYKLTDWNNAGKNKERMEQGLQRVDQGLDGSLQDNFKKSVAISDSDVATGLGQSPQAFKAQKQSMLDRLPTKLREEILASLRGRVSK